MILQKSEILKKEVWDGVGVDIVITPDERGIRSGLRIHFEGFGPEEGPRFFIVPTGLTRHMVTVEFGRFSRPCIEQIKKATPEQIVVARELIKPLNIKYDLQIEPSQNINDWTVTGADFKITVNVLNVPDPTSDEAIGNTTRKILVPLMASMAELIGYDEVSQPSETHDEEGSITEYTIKRRERSRRNRLLCFSIHGERCAVCDFVPTSLYGSAGEILEVHHIEPLSLLDEPKVYNPSTDLVPLCPNCHRAVHTRKPAPLLPEELIGMLQK